MLSGRNKVAFYGLVVALLVPLSRPAVAGDMERAFVKRFGAFDRKEWYISNFDIKADWIQTAWQADAVSRTEDGALRLSLRPADPGAAKPFIGAEVQTRRPLHYGRYEVVMQPARGDGIISSFFTYTGRHFGDPHDEVSIEFLGRDTQRVYLNSYVDGTVAGPAAGVDLGFDAAAGPRLYAFDWSPDGITWFVEDREIRKVTAADQPIPRMPGKLFFSIWTGGEGQVEWAGRAARGATGAANYYCLSYRPPGSVAPRCADYFPPH